MYMDTMVMKTLAKTWVAGLLLAALPVLAQSAVAPPGSGTAADPYRIAELGHLVWMAANAGSSTGKYHALMDDIDATATATWNDAGTDASILEGFRPIGTQSAGFAGSFDGHGHVIRGLTINRPNLEQTSGHHAGLFGWIGSAGAVRRLGLEGGSVTGAEQVGALVGTTLGTVTQCYATGAVTGDAFVGGLVGTNELGTVTQCYATGAVTGREYTVGGLAGGNWLGTVTQCYATGAVTGEAEVGGLLGRHQRGTVTQCYATGPATGGNYVGGLLGTNGNLGTVTQCYATGAVAGREYYVGGLVGNNDVGATIEECYATGAVTGGWGGVGGLMGSGDYASATRCYWDTETSGWTISAGGEGRTTAEMRQPSTYADWDFTDPWGIAADQNDGYPYLRRGEPRLVRFLTGANGVLTGEVSQWVAAGQDAAPVTAVPAYGFVFAQWSDGSTENPRTLIAVSANLELTAWFRPAGPAASPVGAFLAVVGAAEVGQGRGLWDFTGTYPTSVAGYPLTLNLVHDSRGRITGTATLGGIPAGGKVVTAVNLSVKGRLRDAGGTPLLKLTLQGADSARTAQADLSLALVLDAGARRLRGPATGSLRTAAGPAPLTDALALDLPAAMDGTWTLFFDLARRGSRRSSGTALLTLSNGVAHLCAVIGRPSAQALVLRLSGAGTDLAARGITIRATVTPLEGGWARLDAFSGRGYGHTLGW